MGKVGGRSSNSSLRSHCPRAISSSGSSAAPDVSVVVVSVVVAVSVCVVLLLFSSSAGLASSPSSRSASFVSSFGISSVSSCVFVVSITMTGFSASISVFRTSFFMALFFSGLVGGGWLLMFSEVFNYN